jgi:hypothetical protein
MYGFASWRARQVGFLLEAFTGPSRFRMPTQSFSATASHKPNVDDHGDGNPNGVANKVAPQEALT